ncbi:MAG: methyltransferase domain-containing protein [Spirochaetia bacterium]
MGDTYLLRIDNMAFGGDGVGTISSQAVTSEAGTFEAGTSETGTSETGSEVEGIRCFIPFSAPGDLLRVEIVKRKKRFLRGRIVEIVEPSPRRRRPECPLFGRCGGCSWQHIDYREQLEAKKTILLESLRRLGGIALDAGKEDARVKDNIEVKAVASPREYGYRTRVRMRVSPSGRLCFKAVPAGSRDSSGAAGRGDDSLVEIPECPVASEAINRIIRSAYNGKMTFPSKSILLIQETDGEVQWEVERPGGGEIGFFQVNEEVNLLLKEEIFRLALQASGEKGKDGGKTRDEYGGKAEVSGQSGKAELSNLRVLDLFCGNGNLSLPMAAAGAVISGFDSSEGSVKTANETSSKGESVSYRQMDAKKAVRAILKGEILPFDTQRVDTQRADVILLDPPRSGIGVEEMGDLCKIGAATILYVSCDPATLSRDLKNLYKEAYRVEGVMLFDMFPQTSHFESLVVLRI